jgi:hypothetical protein
MNFVFSNFDTSQSTSPAPLVAVLKMYIVQGKHEKILYGDTVQDQY